MDKIIIKFLFFFLFPIFCLSCDNLNTITNNEEILLEPSVIIEDKELSKDNYENLSENTEGVIFYIRGHNYLSRNEFIEAQRTFETLINIEPDFARAWEGRGQSLLLQGKYLDAITDFDQAINLKSNFSQAYANRALAKLALEGGNYNSPAKEDAISAIEINKDSVNAHIVLARIYSLENNFDSALFHHNESIKITNEEDAISFWWRAIFYRDKLKLFNESMNDFNKAISLNPILPSVYLERAILRIIINDDVEIIEKDLIEAISLSEDPKNPKIIERANEIINSLENNN